MANKLKWVKPKAEWHDYLCIVWVMGRAYTGQYHRAEQAFQVDAQIIESFTLSEVSAVIVNPIFKGFDDVETK